MSLRIPVVGLSVDVEVAVLSFPSLFLYNVGFTSKG